MSEEGNRYNYYGHDDGLVVTQPESGKFEQRPMSPAELAARDPARTIARDIYRHANYAGVCYYEIWSIIASAFSDHDRIVAELNAEVKAQKERIAALESKLRECVETLREGSQLEQDIRALLP